MNHQMEVSQDVIMDLLPLFVTQEGSEGTQKLVDEYMRLEPDFAATSLKLTRTLRGMHDPLPCPAEKLQEESFQRTRRAMKRDNILLGFGIAYLAAPFSFFFAGSHVTWFMLHSDPWQALFFVVAGLICLGIRYSLRRNQNLGFQSAGRMPS